MQKSFHGSSVKPVREVGEHAVVQRPLEPGHGDLALAQARDVEHEPVALGAPERHRDLPARRPDGRRPCGPGDEQELEHLDDPVVQPGPEDRELLRQLGHADHHAVGGLELPVQPTREERHPVGLGHQRRLERAQGAGGHAGEAARELRGESLAARGTGDGHELAAQHLVGGLGPLSEVDHGGQVRLD